MPVWMMIKKRPIRHKFESLIPELSSRNHNILVEKSKPVYNKLVKLLILFFPFLITTNYGYSQVSDTEMKTFLEAIKEKKDEELLIASDQFKECQTQFENFRKDTVITSKDDQGNDKTNKELFADCINKKIIGDPNAEGADEKLLEIANNLGLNAFNKQAAESSKSIREYLQKRIRKAIYGDDGNKDAVKKLKSQKYTDHSVYYQLYAEQIGKNTLLEVSKYCLENFGTKDKKQIFIIDEVTDPNSGEKGNVIKFGQVIEEVAPLPQGVAERNKAKFEERLKLREGLTNPATVAQFFKDNFTTQISAGGIFSKNGEQVQEYEVCTHKNEDECKTAFTTKDKAGNSITRPFRSVHELSLLKEAEFALSAKDPDNKIIKDRYGFCAGQVIKNMCEIYKCNNSYNLATSDKIKKRCEDNYGIKVDGKNKTFQQQDPTNDTNEQVENIADFTQSNDQKGAIACNLVQRLDEYRIVLQGVKELQDDMTNNKLSDGTAIRTTTIAGGAITGGFGDTFNQNRIDDLTSISSTELTENVESLKDSESVAEELKANCMDEDKASGLLTLKPEAEGDEKCAILMAKLDKAKFGTIELDTQAKTAAKLKELENIKDQEGLEEFLKKNGLGKFIGRLSELAEDPDKIEEIKNLVAQDFQGKRMALMDRLKEKYRREQGIEVGENLDQDKQDKNLEFKNEIANQTIADVATHKKRVETLFQYSNIVSSFLSVEDKEGNSLGQNTTGRVKELEGLKSEDGAGIAQYFSQGGESDSGGNQGNISYLEAINEFVDFKEKKEEEQTSE